MLPTLSKFVHERYLWKLIGSQSHIFFKDEPIARNFRDINAQFQEELEFFDHELFFGPISDGVSLIVVDPQAGNKVVGMRISQLVER